MATDWMGSLKEATLIIQKTEADALKLIENDNLSLEHADRLLAAINKLGDDFIEVVAKLRADDGLNEELFEAATAIEARWTKLSFACLNKVRDLRGLNPVEMGCRDYPINA